MSLLNQLYDGGMFDIFITSELVTWQLKTAWCQIWTVWWLVWCFLMKLLHQVLSLLCSVWPGTLMEENYTISKKTNMFSTNSLPNAFQRGALPKMVRLETSSCVRWSVSTPCLIACWWEWN